MQVCPDYGGHRSVTRACRVHDVCFRGRHTQYARALGGDHAVRAEADELVIDLHIIVTYGVNIQAIVDSIKNKVRYTVEKSTGRTVKRITVYVDGMKE